MKTKHFELNLVTPQQINKELVINESLLTLDSLIANSVEGFTAELPKDDVDSKFILNSGDKAGYIAYNPSPSKGWQYIKPKKGMIYYVISEHNFFCFDGATWQAIIERGDASAGAGAASAAYAPLKSTASPLLSTNSTNFVGIKDYVALENDKVFNYLFLSGDSELDISNLTHSTTHVIIKQNHERAFNLELKGNILWLHKIPYKVTAEANKMDYIRLHKLPETPHFLGEIVGQGFTY